MPSPTTVAPSFPIDLTDKYSLNGQENPASLERLVEVEAPPNICHSVQLSADNIHDFCNLLCSSPNLVPEVQELRIDSGLTYLTLRDLSVLLSIFSSLRCLRLNRVIISNKSSDIRVPSEGLEQLAPHRRSSQHDVEELDIRSCEFESPDTQVRQLIRLCSPRTLSVHAPKQFDKPRSPRRVSSRKRRDPTQTSVNTRVSRFVHKLRHLAAYDSNNHAVYDATSAFSGSHSLPSLQKLTLSKVNSRFLALIYSSVKCITLKELSVYRVHSGLTRYIHDASWYLTSLRLELDASRFTDTCCEGYITNEAIAHCSQLSTLVFRVNLCTGPSNVWEHVASTIESCHTNIEHIGLEVARWEHFESSSDDTQKDGQRVDSAILKHSGSLRSVEFRWIVDEKQVRPSMGMMREVETWLPRTTERGLLRLGVSS